MYVTYPRRQSKAETQNTIVLEKIGTAEDNHGNVTYSVRTTAVSRTRERMKDGRRDRISNTFKFLYQGKKFLVPAICSVSEAGAGFKATSPTTTIFFMRFTFPPYIYFYFYYYELRRDKQFETTGPTSWNLIMVISKYSSHNQRFQYKCCFQNTLNLVPLAVIQKQFSTRN